MSGMTRQSDQLRATTHGAIPQAAATAQIAIDAMERVPIARKSYQKSQIFA